MSVPAVPPGWWQANDGNWYPPQAPSLPAHDAVPSALASLPDGTRSKRLQVRNGILVVVAMLSSSIGIGVLFAPLFQSDPATRPCKAETDKIGIAMEAARTKAGGYVDQAGLLFIGDLSSTDLPLNHEIVLSGPSAAAMNYALIRVGPCRAAAARADPNQCEIDARKVGTAVAATQSTEAPDSWVAFMENGNVFTVGPLERCPK